VSEIKVGDFIEVYGSGFDATQAVRLMVYGVEADGDRVHLHSVTQKGVLQVWFPKHVTHLPDCTGWDWKPPLELKEGAYYENASGEVVGPLSKDDGKWVCPFHCDRSAVCNYWFYEDGSNNSPQWSLVKEVPKPEPKEPKYRPFKSAEEFAPHKDRWLKLSLTTVQERVVSYDEKSVFTSSGGWKSFETLMKMYTFEDGSPCGVKE
jgi:hypothetical protein